MMRIIVYSDQQILSRGLENLITSDPALELTACCSNVAALKEHLANENADLAVLDLTPEITPAELHQLQNLAPACKLILWTDTIAIDFALEALAIGVRGVLRKTLPLQAHLQCLYKVSAGELWLEKDLTASLGDARRVTLTERESQLVSGLVRGLRNKEIAYELGITEGTVKVYLSRLFQKSGVADRFQMALQGLKNLSLAGFSTDQGGLRSLAMASACR